MKKLVTSIMASAMILGVSSCVDHNFEAPISEQQKLEENFEAAFTKKFGLVHPQQDWGFGESTETKAAMTRGVKANANQWYYTYNVDPNIVMPEYNAITAWAAEDRSNWTVVSQPNWTDFFVTQVHKGNSTLQSYPKNDGETATIRCSDHMDQLGCLKSNGEWDHSFNFNNTSNGNVVNFEGDNTIQIIEKMLMVDSGTKGFRYLDSNASMSGSKYIIVKGCDIPNMPITCHNYYYVCFDFEQPYTQAQKDVETTHAVLNGSYEKKVVSGGDKQIKASVELTSTTIEKAIADLVAFLNGNKYLWVGGNYDLDASNIKNLAYTITSGSWGQILTVTGTYPTGKEPTESWVEVTLNNENFTPSGFYTAEELTASKVLELKGDTAVRNVNIDVRFKGYTNGKDHCDGDNIYNDWIVRISPATLKSDPGDEDEQTGDVITTYRVYAEDLYEETYGGGDSDWDFNDVVFDVVYDRDENKSWVVIQAAGGTLPLYLTVGSQTVEVHAALYNNPDAPTNVMINTRNPNSCEKEPVVVFDNTPGQLDPGNVEIKVKLSEENTITVPTYPGHPSAKFAVDITNYPGVKWAVEIQPIWTVFKNFKEWVNTNQALEFNLPND